MNDYPVKLPVKALSQVPRILPNPINRDINLALQWLRLPAQFKADDVGVIVVLQKLLIDIQHAFIIAENKIEGFQFPTTLLHEFGNSLFQ